MKYIQDFKLFEENTNLNSNFKKWFGKSKIVDNSGNPLIVYHGTKSKFDSFDDKKKGSSTDSGMRGRGFYFSTDIRDSKSYGDIIMELYLKIENPFDLLSFNSIEEISEFLEIDSSILSERGKGKEYPFHSIKVSDSFSGVFSGAVREKGFDGIIHGREYITFNSNQMKSVENDGTFSTTNNNIYK